MVRPAIGGASLCVMLAVFAMIPLACRTSIEKGEGPMLDTCSQGLIEQLNRAIAGNDHRRTAQVLIDIGLKSEGNPQVEEALEAADERVRDWPLPRGIDWPGGKETVTVPGPWGTTREVIESDGWGRRNTLMSTMVKEAMWQIHLRTGYRFRRFEQHAYEKDKGGDE